MTKTSVPDASSTQALVRTLLRIGAVRLRPDEPFQWSSGRYAPIYCDNRLTLGYPEVRRDLTAGFEALIAEHELEPDVVAGTATAGIPHAALLAERLERPLAYVRSRPKGHGRGKQIEGVLERGQRVVLVEDLVSTGGSALGAVEALRSAGSEVVAVLAIFSYGLPVARADFEKARIPLFALASFDALLAEARRELSAENVQVLEAWRRDPEVWSEASGMSASDEEDERPEFVLGRSLMARGKTLAVAESCTGGDMLNRITNIGGASGYLMGGVVVYSNRAKQQQLGVDAKALEEEGAVSDVVARQMAQGVREHFHADIGLATTGIAGPTGGSPEKPVGTVWIALDDGRRAVARKFNFNGDRLENKASTCDAAFEMLREMLWEEEGR